MKYSTTVLILLVALLNTGNSFAQCDTIVTMCEKHITSEYISDGQVYRALVQADELAEFETIFFGGNTYRIAACSGTTDGNLVFRLLDQDKNQLFTNQEYSNAPYWDFHVDSTMTVTVEALLDANKSDSGCAVLLIGFKR